MSDNNEPLDVAGLVPLVYGIKEQACRALLAARRRDYLAAEQHLINVQRGLHTLDMDLGVQRGAFRCG